MSGVLKNYRDMTATERQTEIDLEQEFNCKHYIDARDTFKKKYPKKGVDIKEEYYYDQARRLLNKPGLQIFSAYLPLGISRMESWLGKQIRDENSKYTKKEIEKMIRRNPHLHNVIKTNLLDNLNRIKP